MFLTGTQQKRYRMFRLVFQSITNQSESSGTPYVNTTTVQPKNMVALMNIYGVNSFKLGVLY